jgi:hypothetical protein
MTTYTAWGFDYAYGNGLTIATLQANETNFVCRYLSGTPGAGKDVSKAEIEGLNAAGIAVVLNWETTGLMPSQAQGVADAKSAQAEAETLGLPDAVIYFSADFNPNGNTAEINAYMTGVASVLGKTRTGLYAGYIGVNAYMDAGIGDYAWQTYAWNPVPADPTFDPRAQLQQYQNSVVIGPATVDRDRATAANYGQNPSPVAPAPAAPVAYATPTGMSQTSYATAVSADFAWLTAGTGASYHIQVVEIETKTSVVDETVATNRLTAALTPNTSYEWRVAVDQGQGKDASPWTDLMTFVTPGLN